MNERLSQTYEVAQLYYIQNLTMDTIASRLGVSPRIGVELSVT